MATTSAIGSANSAASTSALESLLSSLNNGSQGINVAAVVSQIIVADSTSMYALQNQQTTLTNQSAAIKLLESESSAVANDLSVLQDPAGALSSVQANSSNSTVVTASAVGGTTLGTHTVSVTNLATAGSYYSAQVASSATQLASGSFDITVAGKTSTIATGSGNGTNDTLDELAASINSQGLGVRAGVINDASGARLSLVSQATGSAADVTISNASSLSFTRTATGTDASLTLDGVPVTSASNTVTGAIAGLTINLQGVSTGTPVTLNLVPDSTSITAAVTSLVSDYNKLIGDVNAQFAYNAATGADGTLSSDSATRSLQSGLLTATNFVSSTSGALSSLQALGISTSQDGTLSIDSTKLAGNLQSNFSGVVGFLQGDSSSAGFAGSLKNILNEYTDPVQGAFTVELSSLNNEYLDLGRQVNTDQVYLSQQQAALTTEYNNANIALQQLPSEIRNTQVLLGDYTPSSGH